MMPQADYTYYLHVAFRMGYTMVTQVSGLPGRDEDFADYLHREIDIARSSPDAEHGILHFSGDAEDVIAASFHREKNEESEIAVPDEEVQGSDSVSVGSPPEPDEVAKALGLPPGSVRPLGSGWLSPGDVPTEGRTRLHLAPSEGSDEVQEQQRSLTESLQSLERVVERMAAVMGVDGDRKQAE